MPSEWWREERLAFVAFDLVPDHAAAPLPPVLLFIIDLALHDVVRVRLVRPNDRADVAAITEWTFG